MRVIYVLIIVQIHLLTKLNATSDKNVLGCGGFIKSHAPIDFTKIEVKLYTKHGTLKDSTFCAPGNGYYFLPSYEKGEYNLQIHPPPGWSFTPKQVNIIIDGQSDSCSQGKDINFVFEGFGITGQVNNLNGEPGPEGVIIELTGHSEKRVTDHNGSFFFTPVYPGTYTITASHPKWKLLKNNYTVQVAKANTELPQNTFVITGYDVQGSIRFQRKPMPNILFFLYSADLNLSQNAECDHSIHPNVPSKENFICFTKSDENGLFEFPCLSSGEYNIRAAFSDNNITYHIEPLNMMFKVERDSVKLTQTFQIEGFTLSGRVLMQHPIERASIYVNDQFITTTKPDGSFTLDKLKAGQANIYVESRGFNFKSRKIDINPYKAIDTVFVAYAFEVCGNVASETSESVHFRSLDDLTDQSIETTQSGDFCIYLGAGNYSASVAASSDDIQYFPLSQLVQVVNAPVSGVHFSQLKASVRGRLNCIQPEHCNGLLVTITPLTHHGTLLDDKSSTVQQLINSRYIFNDVVPGNYEISVGRNNYCWELVKHTINVNSETIDVPEFYQSGYKITFLSSHHLQLLYSSDEKSSKKSSIEIKAGENIHCLPKSGVYAFEINSCHLYEQYVIKYSTDSEHSEIVLNALKHQQSVGIKSNESINDIYITVTIGSSVQTIGPLVANFKDAAYYYVINVHLAENEQAIIVPQSDHLWFQPNQLILTGETDCKNHGARILALRGKVIQGKVIPALEGVRISVHQGGNHNNNNKEEYVRETDVDGKFRFATLDGSYHYTVNASKESFVFTGPDENGNFYAHKLAEIVVISVDQNDESPLKGTLISLSGGESYRSNMITDEFGRMNFSSLQPNQYFLKPMMKEYKFEPSSKIIQLEEGARITIKLVGKRVAYSVYGLVRSLSGRPESQMTVVANGVAECAHYNEEALSEEKGYFRIRGLHPKCKYRLHIKDITQQQQQQQIERVIPESVALQTFHQDIHGVKLTTLRQSQHMDIIVVVESSKPDHFRALRLKLCKESMPNSAVYVMKLDSTEAKSQLLLHLPHLIIDHKTIYFVQLESSSNSKSSAHFKSAPEYFVANTSFKYFTIRYDFQPEVIDHDIGNTSLFALPMFLLLLISFYNIQSIKSFVCELTFVQNYFGATNLNAKPTKSQTMTNISKTVDTHQEIDQLLQTINTNVAAKRKVKPRKT